MPGFEITDWQGLLAPAKTSVAVVERLNRETLRILNERDVKERLAAAGLQVVTTTPVQFAEFIRAEIDKVQGKLANPAFTGKVPPAVLEEHKKRLADWQGKEQQVKKREGGGTDIKICKIQPAHAWRKLLTEQNLFAFAIIDREKIKVVRNSSLLYLNNGINPTMERIMKGVYAKQHFLYPNKQCHTGT